MGKHTINKIYNDERGVSAVLVAILIVVFLGFAALALDLSHLYVTKNQLQNAADAGALAGARFLYNEDGTAVEPEANQKAYDAAVANKSENAPVELLANGDVYASEGATYPIQQDGDDKNNLDILRGHWSFATKHFTANASLDPVDLWGVSEEELDANTMFINAVQVTVRRTTKPGGTPIAAFFARIFRYDSNGDGKIDSSDKHIENFTQKATAVAYIGFAGTLGPGDVDAPIAICQQSVTDNPFATECGDFDTYDCNRGFMLSDGQVKNTAAWTNFSQPCDTADTPELRNLLTCSDANPNEISLGSFMGATNGVNKTVLDDKVNNNLVDCWKQGKYWVNDDDGDGEKDDAEMASIDRNGDGVPDMPWNLTLPVVNCPDSQVANCMETCGAVSVNVVWILVKDNDIDADAPYKMADWDFNTLTPEQQDYNGDGVINGIDRWNLFVEHFNLHTPNGELALYSDDPQKSGYKQKSIYFLPDCTPHKLEGTTGGPNFGVLARIPVLVK